MRRALTIARRRRRHARRRRDGARHVRARAPARRRHRAAVGRSRPPRRAGPLRAARRLGRALPGRPAAGARSTSTCAPSTATRSCGSPSSGDLNAAFVRTQARDALVSYLRLAILVVGRSRGLALGVLVALAVRGGRGPAAARDAAVARRHGARAAASRSSSACRRARTSTARSTTPTGPRCRPRCARCESLGDSSQTLDDEIDEQLVGIARFVNAPAGRPPLGERPAAPDGRLGPAQQRHRAAGARARRARRAAAVRRRPDRPRLAGRAGARAARRARRLAARLRLGQPRLRRARAQARPDRRDRADAQRAPARRRHDRRARRAARRRPADRRLRRPAQAPRARRATATTARRTRPAEQERFAAWLAPLRGKVDVVMVHAPALAQLALEALRDDPPAAPLAARRGPHAQAGARAVGTVTVLNAGSVGGGGTGNLTEAGGDIGLARADVHAAAGVRAARGGSRADRPRRRRGAGAPLPPRAGRGDDRPQP